MPVRSRRSRLAAAALCTALLAACGGDGDSEVPATPSGCAVADQNSWLRNYFNEWYFWYRYAPSVDPAGHVRTAAYFDALLYRGGDRIAGDPSGAAWPSDRWSDFESTESFNRFYGDGQTLGYGVSVAGLEVTGMPTQPLHVRYVEPKSPASEAGVSRGDQVLSINGRSSADVIASEDFSALTANAAGQTLTLALRSAGGDRTVTLTATVFALTPVSRASVVSTPLGRRVGYLVMKDMISQSLTPLDQAFADFRAQAVSDIVLDLRYNGGGLVSVASTLASYVGGTGAADKTFAALLYNDKRAAQYNTTFRFASPAPASAVGLQRVYVLTGRRTCSASEQVINGLRGVGIDAVAVGETTCGKPVGFLPQSDSCGTTYNVVNFESVNERYEGRYFDGFDATCPVAEDWTQPLGSGSEPLLSAAITLADGGACPVLATRERPMSTRRATPGAEPGERQGMIPR